MENRLNMLWFEEETSHIISCISVLGPKLVAFFKEEMKLLGSLLTRFKVNFTKALVI